MAELEVIQHRPFHCGSQAADWEEANCEHCAKGTPDDEIPACPIQRAIFDAYFGDGRVPEDIAERMGYLANSPPRQKGFSYNWRCGEFQRRSRRSDDADRT